MEGHGLPQDMQGSLRMGGWGKGVGGGDGEFSISDSMHGFCNKALVLVPNTDPVFISFCLGSRQKIGILEFGCQWEAERKAWGEKERKVQEAADLVHPAPQPRPRNPTAVHSAKLTLSFERNHRLSRTPSARPGRRRSARCRRPRT